MTQLNKRIGHIQLFCRNGRVMIANSSELNELIKDKGDQFMILPFLFDTNDVQIQQIDAEEFKNLLPNSILTSPYEPKFDEIESIKEQPHYLNSIPFSIKKLQSGVDKLKELVLNSINSLF